MATYKTPGVFIEEISTLGSSIAGVPTAITGFVGYTEKAIIDGIQWPYLLGAPSPPLRITSLLEFQQFFGGPKNELFTVSLTGTVPSPTTIGVAATISNFILFYQVQMFYANGGGTCYISSVGIYSAAPAITQTLLTNAIDKFEQIDEITILSAPEAVFLNVIGDRKAVYNRMALQCAKLQDRFAVLDVVHNGNTLVVGNNTIFQDASDFRNNDISADNLKYAAAYYPALNTPVTYFYKEDEVLITDTRTIGAFPFNYQYNTPINTNNKLTTVLNGTFASKEFTIIGSGALSGLPAQLTIAGVLIDPGSFLPIPPNNIAGAIAIAKFINEDATLSQIVQATVTTVGTTASFRVTAKQVGTIGNTYAYVLGARYTAPGTLFLEGGVGADKALYNRIVSELAKYKVILYPCASMAGSYARVDADRGVWKAPANIGLALVNNPSITITDEEQQNLNVDSVSGKSINAIREFAGRGTLVWGARTLAGNDNEWRYINVRRLFTYVEESSKKATEFVIFEANTAVTWQRVKGMIEAFLTGLWRDGALAGATTKDAFFVRVGLGTTMTQDDILNGKMIVEIGMAASRPAEFIILRFSHKLQES